MRAIELGDDPDAPPRWQLRAIGDVEIRYGVLQPDCDRRLAAGIGARRADRDVRYSAWPGRVKQLAVLEHLWRPERSGDG